MKPGTRCPTCRSVLLNLCWWALALCSPCKAIWCDPTRIKGTT